MANKKKTKRTKRQTSKKFNSAFVLFLSVTLVFIFISITNNFASSNQNGLWAQLMEAFLKGDEARKESLLQEIRASEAAAALAGANASGNAGSVTSQTTSAGQAQNGTSAANWRDYDWSRFGVTNPAYSGRKNNEQYYQYREAETETLPTVVYEDWDPYNYSGLYEETKKSKILTPRFETSYSFNETDEEYAGAYSSTDIDWSTFDWSSFYDETKKSDIIRPVYETTTTSASSWRERFRSTEATTETYNIPKETTKSGILFSVFGSGGDNNEDTTETLQAETTPADDAELIVSGSLIKETKEKSRVIDNQINETTRIITSRATTATQEVGETETTRETTKSAVLKPVSETTVRETRQRNANRNDYEEVVSGSLIKETSIRSRVLDKMVVETTKAETKVREEVQVHNETTVKEETTKSYVLTPEFDDRAKETTRASHAETTKETIKEETTRSYVLTPRFNNNVRETIRETVKEGYEEVVSGSLVKETSTKSRVLDKPVTQGIDQNNDNLQVRDETETTFETTTQVVQETTKSSILFSLFGIGAKKETTARATQPVETSTYSTYETTKEKKKSGILFSVFEDDEDDETQVTETASAYTEYDEETIVAGSIFDETKRKARIIDKSADRAQSATQYETTALLRETTFDARPFEVKWPISLIGAGGWYFLKNVSILDSETADGKIPEYYNRQLVEKLEKCRKLLGKSKKDFAIILCPDKSAIYKEFYPAGSPYPNESSKIKSFIDYAKANSDLSVIYPDRAISFVKNVCDVYYKQDSHWNRIAGYIATRELFEMMGINYTLDSIMSHEIEVSKKLYPGDLYDDGTDVEYDLKGITDGSYVNKADYSGVDFTNDKAPMHIKAHNPVDRRSALVIRDSFIASMLPALGSQFKETSLYHIENYTSIDKQALKKDVIIIELTARNFISLFNLADYLISILEG